MNFSEFKKIAETVPGQLYELDLETASFRFHNNWTEHFLEESLEDKSIEDVIAQAIHPDDVPRIRQSLLKAIHLKDGEQSSLEFRVVTRKGKVKWAKRIHMVSERDSKGVPKKLIGLITDTTLEKERERQLQFSQERLMKAERIAKIGHWEWNIETGDLLWSNEVYRIFGVDPENFKPDYEQFLARIPEPDRKHVEDAVKVSLETGDEYRIDHKIVLTDTIKWVREVGEVEYDGKWPIRMMGTVQDVTDAKISELALQKRERTYRSILEGLGEVVYRYDIDSLEFEYVSPAADSILGCSAQDILSDNDNFTRLIHPDFIDHYNSSMERIIDGGDTSSFEYKIITPENEERWILHSADGLYDSRGNLLMIEGVLRNNTVKKQIELDLIKSLEDKDILLKELHHRVKNNLQVISGLLDLSLNPEEDTTLEDILTESKSRIKTISLIHERLYQSDEISNIDFANYLKDLLGHTISSYSVRSIDLDVSLDPAVMNLDRAMPLGLMCNEIITNTLKHAWPGNTESKRSLSVVLENKNEHCSLRFCDNGVGFDMDDVKKSDSLGHQLIHSLARQIKAELQFEINDGTAINIVLHHEH